jgi:hypothetical protein
MSEQAFPLRWPEGWPRTPYGHKKSGDEFKRQASPGSLAKAMPSFSKSRDRLLDELRLLKASSVVISTNHKPDRYGIPVEAKRRPDDDGVAVYFVLNKRPMVMACDRFTTAAANMTSLALAFDAMRQLGRHGGGTMMNRAFDGFVAIAAPGKTWWDVLECRPDATREVIEAQYRRLARDRHPDSQSGSHDAMTALNEARDAAIKARAA